MNAREVTVYSRDDCHLCGEAIETIERVAADVEVPVTVEEVDVDDDPRLAEEYGERVPYVFIDGRPTFKFRIDEEDLRSVLRSKQADSGRQPEP